MGDDLPPYMEFGVVSQVGTESTIAPQLRDLGSYYLGCAGWVLGDSVDTSSKVVTS